VPGRRPPLPLLARRAHLDRPGAPSRGLGARPKTSWVAGRTRGCSAFVTRDRRAAAGEASAALYGTRRMAIGAVQAREERAVLVSPRGAYNGAGLRAQREALSHELLRDLPETVRVARIERVRLDPVERIGSVVHRRDVTVLEVEPAPPLELGRGRGEHRRRRPGLDRLDLHPAGASLEELPVLALQVPAELGHDAARM